jgi:glycosyltransferase involved in cell wall biosynthesis
LILRVKIPIFWSLRTSGLPKKSKLSSKLNLLVVVIFSYLIPHKIVSCSKEASDSHIKLGYTSKNHIVISNFPDDWSVNSKSNSQLLKEKKLNKIKIGIAARFTNGKSQELMLQLLKYYVDSGDTTIYLSFCGQDTNVNGKLFELTKNLYPTILNRCEFLGNLFGDEYSNWHQNIDIFCLPSITEGVPNAFLEACSLGTPVIGTRLEPTLKMCDNTVLIDKGNLNIFSLKEKINFWLNLELPNRIKISDENQSRCERFFNKREIISNYINLYKI